MNELRVTLFHPIVSHATPEEAIASIRDGTLYKRPRGERPVIIDCSFTFQSCRLRLDNGSTAIIDADHRARIRCRLVREPWSAPPRLSLKPVRLCYWREHDPEIDDEPTLRSRDRGRVWDPNETPRLIRNGKLYQIFYNKDCNCMWIYTEGKPDIMFNVYRIVGTQDSMLHWSVDED